MMNMLLLGLSALAGVSSLDIKIANTGGNATSGLQYGIMFEDINHSGDGGVYAELIRNRAFQGSSTHPSTLSPWTAIGSATLALRNLSQPLSSALPTSLEVTASSGVVGISNPGYWGIDVKVQKYTGSFWVKGTYNASFTTSLFNYISNTTLESVEVPSQSTANKWTEHTFELEPEKEAGNVNNTFRITFDASATAGALDFNLISLFPPTYKDRPNGLRPDLMEALEGLNPSFLRFPGGNNLEGEEPPYYLKWNETIGPLRNRPGYPGTWNYQNTNGLGLVEYLQWCEDLSMEPVLAIWGGFYLQGPVIPSDELKPYIDDALNQLEFITGNTSTEYGALRASLGYPEPWSIKYVEIGNEDNLGGGGASYQAYRFQAFKTAISDKYPDMFVFASTSDYDFAETGDAKTGEDYHEYTRPDYFAGQFDFFDHWPGGFKTMIGEYATVQENRAQGGSVNWTAPKIPFPTWLGTISEAIFLLGAERNADKIFGAAYAPLFQNLNAYQWTPNLISYTADTTPAATTLSTSYHMIHLLSTHRITTVLPLEPDTPPIFNPAYYVAGYANETASYLLKTAVYNSSAPVEMSVSFRGVGGGAEGTLVVLTAGEAGSFNGGVGGGEVVERWEGTVRAGEGGVFVFEVPELSVSVLEVRA